jgi:hypothetical protein
MKQSNSHVSNQNWNAPPKKHHRLDHNMRGSCYNCSTKCILYEKKHHRRKNRKEEKTTGKHQYLKTNTRTKSFAEEKNKKKHVKVTRV